MTDETKTHSTGWLWRDDVLFDENDKEIFCLPEIHRNLDSSVKCKIAAAPDLLAACEAVAETTWSRNVAVIIGDQVRAAIKKAKGG